MSRRSLIVTMQKVPQPPQNIRLFFFTPVPFAWQASQQNKLPLVIFRVFFFSSHFGRLARYCLMPIFSVSLSLSDERKTGSILESRIIQLSRTAEKP